MEKQNTQFNFLFFSDFNLKQKKKLNCTFVVTKEKLFFGKKNVESFCYFELDARRARTNGEYSLVENSEGNCERYPRRLANR